MRGVSAPELVVHEHWGGGVEGLGEGLDGEEVIVGDARAPV